MYQVEIFIAGRTFTTSEQGRENIFKAMLSTREFGFLRIHKEISVYVGV